MFIGKFHLSMNADLLRWCLWSCVTLTVFTYPARADLLEALFTYIEEPVFFSVNADNDVNTPHVTFVYSVPLKSLKIPRRDLKRLTRVLNRSYNSNSFDQKPLVRALQKQVNVRFEFRRGTDVVALCKPPNQYLQLDPGFDNNGYQIWVLDTVFEVQLPIQNPLSYERKICIDPTTRKSIVPILQDGDRAVLMQKKSSILGEEELFLCFESECAHAFD